MKKRVTFYKGKASRGWWKPDTAIEGETHFGEAF